MPRAPSRPSWICAAGGRVSRFEADWLALREPSDHAARSAALAARFAAARRAGAPIWSTSAPAPAAICAIWRRACRPAQRWLLVDHDPALLAQAPRAAGATVALPGRWISREQLPELPASRTGVTAAALLDLASAAWLDRLARWCRRPAGADRADRRRPPRLAARGAGGRRRAGALLRPPAHRQGLRPGARPRRGAPPRRAASRPTGSG